MKKLILLAMLVPTLVGCGTSGRQTADWVVPGASTYYHYQDVQEEVAASDASGVLVRPSEVGGTVDLAIEPATVARTLSADPGGFLVAAAKDVLKGVVWVFLGKKAYDEWGRSSDSPPPPAFDLQGDNLEFQVYEGVDLPESFRLRGDGGRATFGEPRPEPEPVETEDPIE